MYLLTLYNTLTPGEQFGIICIAVVAFLGFMSAINESKRV